VAQLSISPLSPPRFLALALVAGLSLVARPVSGQAAEVYAVDVRNVDLDDALRAFATRTGSAVAFDPEHVRSLRTTCGISTDSIEDYLRCLLDGTGLEYFKRASGTYVVGPALQLPATFGLVEGVVGEAPGGAPVGWAHVNLGSRGTVSAPGGHFLLADLLPGRYAVTVSHIGYTTWSDSVDVLPGGRTRVAPALTPSVLSVQPIVVEQNGTALHPIDEATQVRSSRLLPTLLAGNLTDLTSEIHLQGGDAGDLMIQLDGHPVYLPRQLASVIGPFGGLSIDRVRVQRAGFGADGGSLVGGVLNFEQSLRDQAGAEFSASPYEIAGRVGGRKEFGLSNTTLSVGGRTSLLDKTHPRELEDALTSWYRPDPFVLFAPIRAYSQATDQNVGRLYDLSATVPSLGFSDLHVKAEHRTPSGGKLTGSLFHGRRSMSGDRRRASFGEDLAAQDFAPLLSSVASHRWNTTTGALDWTSLLGSKTFLAASTRFSRYRYRHSYLLAELAEPAGGSVLPGEAQALDLGDAADGNDFDEVELSLRADHSRGAHLVSAGLNVVRTTSAFELRLAAVQAGEAAEVLSGPFDTLDPEGAETLDVFFVGHRELNNSSSSSRVGLWFSDRYESGPVTVEAGMRFSLRPERATVYAEPRLRVALQTAPGFVAAVSAGLYRQFTNQLDYSTLNAGEFVPSTRIWLPLDETMSPPRAVHLAVDMDWRPAENWRVSASTYWKRIDAGVALNYASALGAGSGESTIDQRELLTRRDARHVGVQLTAVHSGPVGRTSLRYELARDRLRSAALFGGRSVPAPWEIPHRISGSHDVGLGQWTFGATASVEAGASWALKQAYYDYFGHAAETREHAGWDLGDPGAHRRGVRARLDLAVAYAPALPVGRARISVEIQNLLDRQNELDRRLIWDGSALKSDARFLPGRTVVIAVQMGW
jgi:Carboxypeptidase regulatory-like domain